MTNNPLYKRLKAHAKLYASRYVHWANLSYIGTNPVSKLVVFAPVVAQILIHQRDLTFFESLDLRHLDWAYWSLISFAVGQLVYTFSCPSDIKSFPNRHNYIQALDISETNKKLRQEAFDIIKEHFTEYGGCLNLSDDVVELFRRKKSVNQLRSARFGNFSDTNQSEMFSDALVKLRKSLKIGKLEEIDWHQIEKNLHLLDDHIVNKKEVPWWSIYLYGLEYDIKTYATSSHWRVSLLDRRYYTENVSMIWRRGICFVFYFIGMLYFIYTGIFNVLRVMSTYF